MIVRILGEGQFLVPDDALDELNALDAALETSLDGTDEAAFRAALDALLGRVRELGSAVDAQILVESDVVLPPSDAEEEEVRDMLTAEGLIPG